jgi:transcriptional regulator with XRE-family HTH domain
VDKTNWVKLFRLNNGLEQKEFSERINLPQGTLSKIERGLLKPSYKMTQKIMTEFKTDLREYFRNEN